MFEMLLPTRQVTEAGYPPGWVMLPNLAIARRRHGSVALDNRVYMLGGTAVGNSQSADLFYLDTETDLYIPLSPMPRGGTLFGIAHSGGKIYVYGGTSAANTQGTPDLFCYDPAIDSWTTLVAASVPAERRGATMEALDGKLYVAGGVRSSATYLNDFWNYDIVSNTWTKLANLPLAVYGSALVTVDGMLYLLGGYISTGVSASVYRYNPSLNTWVQIASLPGTWGGGGFCSMGGKGYLFGGSLSGSTINKLYDFNGLTATEILRTGPMPTARIQPALAGMKGSLYISGGLSSEVSAEVYRATL